MWLVIGTLIWDVRGGSSKTLYRKYPEKDGELQLKKYSHWFFPYIA